MILLPKPRQRWAALGGGDGSNEGKSRGDIRDIDWGMLAARCQRFYMAGEPTVWVANAVDAPGFFFG